MADCFLALLDGRCTPGEFERHLLAGCDADPEQGWQALALLDRAYRQRRISDELCRSLRQRIGARAMRREGYEVEVESAAPAEPGAIAALHLALEAPPPPAPLEVRPSPRPAPLRPIAAPVISRAAGTAASRGWARRSVHSSPALALVCAVLGVAASTKVQDPPAILQAPAVADPDPEPAAAATASDPSVVSLSSDRYVVRGHQRALEFTVQRSGDTSAASSFRWWTEPAGAHSGDDYLGTRNQLVTLQPGEDSARLTVRILPNPRRRHIEMFYVAIGVGPDSPGVGEIRRAAVFVFPDTME